MNGAGTGSRPGSALLTAVFLQGLAMLALEVILTRVLSVVMWHHFASLVISLALLGTTVGAVAVYLRPRLAGRGGETSSLAALSLVAGLATLGIFFFFWLVTARPSLGYHLFGVLHQPYYEPFAARAGGTSYLGLLPQLLTLFVVMAAPFAAGGAFVTASLTRWASRAGTVYAADLLGAGFGCFAAVLLLDRMDGLSALAAAAVPWLLAAVPLCRRGAWRRVTSALVLVAAVLALVNAADPLVKLDFVRGRYQPDVAHEAWNATSRVVVYPLGTEQEEGSWGQSRSVPDRVPPQMGLVVDDTGYTSMTAWPNDGDLSFMRHNLVALPYHLKPAADTLIIGPGGGRDILAALSMGARRILAVEINPLVVDAVDRVFGDFTGRLYSREGVETRVAEGRSFLRRHRDLHDVIQASVVYGRLPPSAGAFTLTEDNLYTRESFREYLEHLEPGGLLSISRFIYEKRMLRLVSLARTALLDLGASDPPGHIFIAAERGLANVIIKKAPFTPAEVETLEETCRRLGFRVLLSPSGDGSGSFARLADPAAAAAFQDEFPFDVSAPNDDRPYFYYLLKPRDFWRSLVLGGEYEFEDRAVVVIRNALLALLVFVALLVILPLSRRAPGGGSARAALGTLAFFGGIALGFITFEIVLIKSLILYLGHPVHALVVVLASLLLSTGLGSLASERLLPGPRPGTVRLWLAAAALLIAIFPFLSGPVLRGTVAAPLAARVAVAALFIAPVGFVLGTALPSGVRLLRGRRRALVPWAFGINGALSTVGAMTALMLALNYGFRATMLAAPAGYLLALWAVPLLDGGADDA